MSSPIIHRCHQCGYESEITTSLSVFNENPFCQQCGLSASESDMKMQDELSRLIDQQLNLNHQPVQKHNEVSTPITYITQHYHHSAHAAPVATVLPDSPAQQLIVAGIDITTLSASQLRLFSNALPEQQARLIELWQIAPPTLSEKTVGNWPQTSLQQEEELAQARYLKMTSPITLQQEKSMTFQHSDVHQHAEPYMVNGYTSTEQPANALHSSDQQTADYNRATDPVYQSREWWAHNTNMSQAEQMEHQYGAFAQMRSFYGDAQPLAAHTGDGDAEML